MGENLEDDRLENRHSRLRGNPVSSVNVGHMDSRLRGKDDGGTGFPLPRE